MLFQLDKTASVLHSNSFHGMSRKSLYFLKSRHHCLPNLCKPFFGLVRNLCMRGLAWKDVVYIQLLKRCLCL
jgi:hypothetical protein